MISEHLGRCVLCLHPPWTTSRLATATSGDGPRTLHLCPAAAVTAPERPRCPLVNTLDRGSGPGCPGKPPTLSPPGRVQPPGARLRPSEEPVPHGPGEPCVWGQGDSQHLSRRLACGPLRNGFKPRDSLLGVGGNRFPFSRLTDQTSHFSFSATKYTCVSQEPLRQ